MQTETTIKLGEIARLAMGQSPDSRFVHEEEKGVPFLQGNAEFGGLFPLARLYCSAPTKMCRRGDVLISVRAPVGALNKADQDYCIGRGLAAVRFNEVLPEFGWHVLNHWASNLRVVAQGTTFEAVGKAELWQLDVGPSFSLLEQRRIAEILDTADGAIAQTEALIAKLKQMKAGLLHDLLTRGLDENGQLRDPVAYPEQFKDSPQGRIPREWEVKIVQEVLEQIIDFRGRTPKKLGMEWGGGEIPALSANNVEMGRINFAKETYFGSEALHERWMTKGDTEQGDIIMTLEAPLGNIAQIPDNRKYILSQRVVLLKTRRNIVSNDYLKHQMMHDRFQSMLRNNSTGTIRWTPSSRHRKYHS